MRKNKTKWFSVVLVLLCLTGAFLYKNLGRSFDSPVSHAAIEFKAYEQQVAKIGKKRFTLYVADTDDKRAQGLSDIENLSHSEGMAFIFDKPAQYGFWMKDMRFALDFVYVRNGMIVDLIENVQPNTYPASITPKLAADTIIELNAGQIKESKVKIGDPFELK